MAGPMSALMFTYPVHQAADILFCHANLVPVGKDQLPHVEGTRTIARRFNERYAAAEPYFPLPDALLTDAPLLLGVDGQKMSKSRPNAIALAATEDETARLIRGARTDGERHDQLPADQPAGGGQPGADRRAVPGPAAGEVAARIGDGGAAALKRLVTEALNERLRPIRARRREFAADPGYLRQVLADGNARARAIADRTLSDVQSAHAHQLLTLVTPATASQWPQLVINRLLSLGQHRSVDHERVGPGQEGSSRVGRAVSSTVPSGRRVMCQVLAPSFSVTQSTSSVFSKISPVPLSVA